MATGSRSTATLAGAGGCRLAGCRFGTRWAGRSWIALALIGALITTLIGPTVTLVSVAAAIRTTIDRAAIAAMAPTWPPDLDERDFGCCWRGVSLS